MSLRHLLPVLLLVSCSQPDASRPPDFPRIDANEAKLAAEGLVKDVTSVRYACGPSAGQGLWAYEVEKGLQPDGVKEGRLVFVEREGGRPDVIYKDATGRYMSSLDDGGDIVNLQPDVWIVSYGGVNAVESHNIVQIDNRYFNYWTTNKAEGVSGPSMKLFVSACQEF